MDQQRIDELQNQYFREKLATVDAKRLKEARELLERNRLSAGAPVERVRPKVSTSNRSSQDDQRT